MMWKYFIGFHDGNERIILIQIVYKVHKGKLERPPLHFSNCFMTVCYITKLSTVVYTSGIFTFIVKAQSIYIVIYVHVNLVDIWLNKSRIVIDWINSQRYVKYLMMSVFASKVHLFIFICTRDMYKYFLI